MSESQQRERVTKLASATGFSPITLIIGIFPTLLLRFLRNGKLAA